MGFDVGEALAAVVSSVSQVIHLLDLTIDLLTVSETISKTISETFFHHCQRDSPSIETSQ